MQTQSKDGKIQQPGFFHKNRFIFLTLALIGLGYTSIILPFSPQFLLWSVLTGLVWFAFACAYLQTGLYIFHVFTLMGFTIGTREAKDFYYGDAYGIWPVIQMMSCALAVLIIAYLLFQPWVRRKMKERLKTLETRSARPKSLESLDD